MADEIMIAVVFPMIVLKMVPCSSKRGKYYSLSQTRSTKPNTLIPFSMQKYNFQDTQEPKLALFIVKVLKNRVIFVNYRSPYL